MAEEQVEVQYIDSALAAAHGSRPFMIGVRLARQYLDRGYVRILGKLPEANPSIPTDKKDPLLSKMPEEENLTKVAWVTADYIDAIIQKVGIRLGFKIDQYTPNRFSPGELMRVKFLVVESNIKGYTGGQLENLRAILFQKRIPYVFRVTGYDNSLYFQNCLIHSKLNIFISEQIFNWACEQHEEIIGNWLVESKSDPYKLWRAVDEAIHGKKQEKPIEVVSEEKSGAEERAEEVTQVSEKASETKKSVKKLVKKAKKP